jgi:hypothetical protein
MPAALTMNEDGILTLGGGNAISIIDIDGAGGILEVTLTATNGTLTLASLAGLTFTTGDGSGDDTLVFSGTLASINAALNGMTFAPRPITTARRASPSPPTTRATTGSGGAMSDSDTLAITVNAVNDAPVNVVPPAQIVDEDTTLVFSSGNGNAYHDHRCRRRDCTRHPHRHQWQS